jgi:hypothetical protein
MTNRDDRVTWLLGKLLAVARLTLDNKWSISFYSVKSDELRTGCRRAASRLLFRRAWVSFGKPERNEPLGIADAESLLHRTRLFKMIIKMTKMFAPPILGRRVTYWSCKNLERGGIWTEFKWFNLGNNVGLLWTRQWSSQLRNWRGISWLAEQLIS